MTDAIDSRTRASLLAAVGQCDQAAWSTFFERYEGLIRARCRRRGLCSAVVDDLTQMVMVKLVKAMPTYQYDPSRKFRHWLQTVVRHTVTDHLRQLGRQDRDAANLLGALGGLAGPAADEIVQELEEQWERDLLLREACRRVKESVEEQTWRAFWMMAVEGRTGKEVAEALGIKEATTYMIKYRTTNAIRKAAESLATPGGEP